LSEAVAEKISAYDWAKIVVAETPDQASLVKSVKEFVTLGNFAKLKR